MSDLTIDIEVTDITPYNAQLSITASNNKDSYACVFVSREQAPNSEDEYTQMLQIMEYLDPPILQGSYSEQLGPLTPDTEYTVLAFGVEDNDRPALTLIANKLYCAVNGDIFNFGNPQLSILFLHTIYFLFIYY